YLFTTTAKSRTSLPSFSVNFFFFNATPPTDIYTLSLHDALPIFFSVIYNGLLHPFPYKGGDRLVNFMIHDVKESRPGGRSGYSIDRKSTRLNSSHVAISYAVFCLKKKMSTNCVVGVLVMLHGS